MNEVFPLPEIPGYVSIKQAARMLGVAERSVYRYIETGRLPAYQAGNILMLSLEVVEQFQVNFIHTPSWRISPEASPFLVTYIRVQIRPGMQVKLIEKLHAIKKEKRFIFPGTITRYISLDDVSPPTVTIQLVWKSGDASDEAIRKEAVAGFEGELKDVLDWGTAEYVTSRAVIHT